jgi:hypothetical protein
MKALMGLIAVLSVPLMILNMLGGLVSGIWLAILGDWSAIGYGIFSFILSSWLLSFAIAPSMLLVVAATYFLEKGKTFWFTCFGALSGGYVLALVTVWCCGILYLFMHGTNTSSFIPRLIWSYGVAIGPWAYMASKDQGPGNQGFASSLATFLAELAYITIMLLVIFSPITLLGAVKVFGGFMLVGLVVQMSLAVLIQNERKKFAEQSAL